MIVSSIDRCWSTNWFLFGGFLFFLATFLDEKIPFDIPMVSQIQQRSSSTKYLVVTVFNPSGIRGQYNTWIVKPLTSWHALFALLKTTCERFAFYPWGDFETALNNPSGILRNPKLQRRFELKAPCHTCWVITGHFIRILAQATCWLMMISFML